MPRLPRLDAPGVLSRVPRDDGPGDRKAEVLGRFGDHLGDARRRYRGFVIAAAGQGRRPNLMGGGLLRSHGGWVGVSALRRGGEAYRSDERILESVLESGSRLDRLLPKAVLS